MTLYPLRFEPILQRYLWGGRRLGTVLGKAIGSESDYAESWEVVDHDQAQSLIIAGEWQGISLSEAFRRWGAELLGGGYADWIATERPSSLQHRFPLLFKFLDCNLDLSVQIHPNDSQARKQLPPDLGKTEAWVVLEAAPGAAVYVGLIASADRQDLAKAVAAGQTESVLHRFEPRPGDCIFVPAGTVHALGAGLLVAELQQASNTTYRLFDWNRVGTDGQPRPLHITESLSVLRDDCGPVSAVIPQSLSSARERLVDCDQFVLDRERIARHATIGGDGSFHLIAMIDGEGSLENVER